MELAHWIASKHNRQMHIVLIVIINLWFRLISTRCLLTDRNHSISLSNSFSLEIIRPFGWIEVNWLDSEWIHSASFHLSPQSIRCATKTIIQGIEIAMNSNGNIKSIVNLRVTIPLRVKSNGIAPNPTQVFEFIFSFEIPHKLNIYFTLHEYSSRRRWDKSVNHRMKCTDGAKNSIISNWTNNSDGRRIESEMSLGDYLLRWLRLSHGR